MILDRKTGKYAGRRSNWRTPGGIVWTNDIGSVYFQGSIFEMANFIRNLEGYQVDVSSFGMVSLDIDAINSDTL
jgi:hypothetical protein